MTLALFTKMNPEIQAYNNQQTSSDKAICEMLSKTIEDGLNEAESKIWHAHPVWFLDGNPIVGYSKQKAGWRLMFWSGADFEEEKLNIKGKKFKDASIFYTRAKKTGKYILRKTARWERRCWRVIPPAQLL